MLRLSGTGRADIDTRRYMQRFSPARFSVFVTIAAVVLVSAAATATLVLWPEEDEFGFVGAWKVVASTAGAGGVVRIDLRHHGWEVTGIGLALLGDGRPKPAHIAGRTLVLDSGTADIRFTVDNSRNHLTMTSRSATGPRVTVFVRM
jgi:hypothetical protein